MIIYLKCSNNKRSKTVGDCFAKAVSKLGWPSRVRGDYGTENNEIERKMVQKWGVAHRPYLRGRCVCGTVWDMCCILTDHGLYCH